MNRRAAGVALLVLSLVPGVAQLYFNTFVDEADNLAVGALVAHGAVLYRDVFSHHFPLAYWWAAAVFLLCGKSILAVRLSILALDVAVFGLAIALTDFALPVGIAAVVWQTIAGLYYGNSLTYHTLAGVALFGTFVGTLSVMVGTAPPTRALAAFVAACGAVAVLANPLAGWALAICVVVLATTQRGRGTGAIVAGAAGAALLIAEAVLLAGGAWRAFVADVVRFNADVYRRYLPIEPFPLGTAAVRAVTLLDVFDPRWSNADPFYLLTNRAPDRWVFTGLFFRLAILGATGAFLVRRRFHAAALLYCFAAMLLATRADERFPAIPLVLVGLFAGGWVASELSGRTGAARAAAWTSRAVAAGVLAWIALRGAGTLVANRAQLSWDASFGRVERTAATLRRAACGRDAALGVYPAEPLLYFFSGMRPVAGYPFVYPWVAEVALDRIVDALAHQDAVVAIDVGGSVWGYKNRDYLAPVIRAVQSGYHQVATSVWVSPSVWEACQRAPAGTR